MTTRSSTSVKPARGTRNAGPVLWRRCMSSYRHLRLIPNPPMGKDGCLLCRTTKGGPPGPPFVCFLPPGALVQPGYVQPRGLVSPLAGARATALAPSCRCTWWPVALRAIVNVLSVSDVAVTE